MKKEKDNYRSYTDLISNLKSNTKRIWDEFMQFLFSFYNIKELDFKIKIKEIKKEYFTEAVTKYLKLNNIIIINSYNNFNGKLEYIVYFSNQVIDLESYEECYINPYYDIIERCFNHLNSLK